MTIPIRLALFLLLGLNLGPWLGGAARGADSLEPPRPVEPSVRFPAEFEKQQALLFAWEPAHDAAARVLAQIAREVVPRTPVIVLAPTAEDAATAAAHFRDAGVPPKSLRVHPLAVDTTWVRDFGPAVLRTADGRGLLLDGEYAEHGRPNDDEVPQSLARLLRMPVARVPLKLEGGNLLSNGRGVLVTTTKTLTDNLDRGLDRADVVRIFRDTCGTSRVVFLEPLAGEPTGHVDMFATFTAEDTVVVGWYSRAVDPVNAEVLDRNAEQLAKVRTRRGPLRVYRIPMPANDDWSLWRSYTNVVYANGTLLVPTYPGFEAHEREAAFAMYRRLLRGWKVVGIDCNELIESGGALHCVTCNLAAVSPTPLLARTRRPRVVAPAAGSQSPPALSPPVPLPAARLRQ